MINENQLEKQCIRWFQQVGWNFVHGPDIAPDCPSAERADYREVVLKDRLRDAITKLNPKLPEIAVEEVVHTLTNSSLPNLAKGNRELHALLINGVKVEYNSEAGRETVFAQVVDFQNPDNNDLLVGRQLWGELHSKQDATPAWLKSWMDRIPQFDCLCRSEFMEILKEHPPQFGDEYFPWTNRVHNEVNARLTAQGTPRPQFSLAQAYSLWRREGIYDASPPKSEQPVVRDRKCQPALCSVASPSMDEQ